MFATAATGARVVPLKVLGLSKRFGSRVALSWRDWRRGDWRRRAPPGINRTTYAPRPRHTLVLPVPDGDTHYLLLLYDYVGDVLERRAPYREEHLERIRAGRDAGEIVMAGPLGDPPRGAAIVFKGIDEEAVQRFARQDPYVQAGLVPSWRAARWSVLQRRRGQPPGDHPERRQISPVSSERDGLSADSSAPPARHTRASRPRS